MKAKSLPLVLAAFVSVFECEPTLVTEENTKQGSKDHCWRTGNDKDKDTYKKNRQIGLSRVGKIKTDNLKHEQRDKLDDSTTCLDQLCEYVCVRVCALNVDKIFSQYEKLSLFSHCEFKSDLCFILRQGTKWQNLLLSSKSEHIFP